MTDKFNLSDKIYDNFEDAPVIDAGDVREFIERVKHEIDHIQKLEDGFELMDLIKSKIDKLAGDKFHD